MYQLEERVLDRDDTLRHAESEIPIENSGECVDLRSDAEIIVLPAYQEDLDGFVARSMARRP